jgi:hypothetical protein
LAGTPPTPPEGLVKIEWLTFRANALAVVTQAVPGTYTGLLSWNPEYKMSEKWGLGLNLGYSIYRKTNTEIFSVLEYAVTGSYEIEKPGLYPLGRGRGSYPWEGIYLYRFC